MRTNEIYNTEDLLDGDWIYSDQGPEFGDLNSELTDAGHLAPNEPLGIEEVRRYCRPFLIAAGCHVCTPSELARKLLDSIAVPAQSMRIVGEAYILADALLTERNSNVHYR